MSVEGKGRFVFYRPGELGYALYPDQTPDIALRQMGEWPLLPVVHRADSSKLVGVLSLGDILGTYRKRGPALHELAEPAD